MIRITIKTTARNEMIDITDLLRSRLREDGITRGVCHLFVPHTTAAVTINEKADPDVTRDIMDRLEKLAPSGAAYRHMEGNAPAHIKAALLGPSEFIFVDKGDFVFGRWQAVFFCEFDGPRTRQIIVKNTPTD